MNTTTALKDDAFQLVSDLTAIAMEPKVVGGTTHLTLPGHFKHVDLTKAIEQAQPAPNRKTGTVRVHDVASLLCYCQDQAAGSDGYIYADIDNRSLTAIFNDSKAGAGWRDHRAVWQAELTPQAAKWIGHNTDHFTQEAFAEFIEDNMADLGEDSRHLLEVATTISGTTGIAFGSAKRLQDGQVQLSYNETIDTKAGADGSLKIPKVFTLVMQLFKGAPNADVFKARLKYRLMGGGAIKFWYELDRYENVMEVAFADYVQLVREQSGYTVLSGKA